MVDKRISTLSFCHLLPHADLFMGEMSHRVDPSGTNSKKVQIPKIKTCIHQITWQLQQGFKLKQIEILKLVLNGNDFSKNVFFVLETQQFKVILATCPHDSKNFRKSNFLCIHPSVQLFFVNVPCIVKAKYSGVNFFLLRRNSLFIKYRL